MHHFQREFVLHSKLSKILRHLNWDGVSPDVEKIRMGVLLNKCDLESRDVEVKKVRMAATNHATAGLPPFGVFYVGWGRLLHFFLSSLDNPPDGTQILERTFFLKKDTGYV